MSRSGFRIIQLRLSGPGKPDATLEFHPGLNVICGPSDTGKTYAYQCIDYMLGGRKPPKTIPEAYGYDTVSLTIQPRDSDSTQLLQRSLGGGDFLYTDEGQVPVPLKAEHDPKRSDTVSRLLLDMSGLAERTIKFKANKTRGLSFRDVCRLALVDEEEVIREHSPIHSGQFVSATAEKSVFRMMLEGTDDSALVLEDNSQPAGGKQRHQVIAELVERTKSQLETLAAPAKRESLLALIDQEEQAHRGAQDALAASAARIDELQATRRDSWRVLRGAQSQLDVEEQVGIRLALLETQYQSDMDRLQSMIETYDRLRQMPMEPCPACGADAEHQMVQIDVDDSVVIACSAELHRVSMLLSDLRSTIVAAEESATRLRLSCSEAQAALASIDEELGARLQGVASDAAAELEDIGRRLNPLRQALVLFDQLDVLAEVKLGHPSSPVTQTPTKRSDRPSPVALEEFSLIAQRILTEWHFPNLDRVVFSDAEWDFVISSRPRGSHGKGVRAITHAAFNLALLAYCDDKSLPHPGVFVVDSPLVVYREPDSDEQGFAPQVKDFFYRSLAEGFNDDQVVVIENLNPPADIDAVANVIAFTGSDSGRRGFIPEH